MWNPDLYQKAIAFAGYAHRNQLVPGKDYNYIVHVSSVAAEVAGAICAEKIGDEDLAIQCALLHDVIEDSDFGPEILGQEFGEKVLKGVLALTKDETLPRERRLDDSLARILGEGREIACVKMADRITNLQRPPGHWTREKREAYLAEARAIHRALGGSSAILGRRLEEKIEEYAMYL